RIPAASIPCSCHDLHPQARPQIMQRGVQSRLHSANRKLQNLRHLRVCQPCVITEKDDFASRLLELRDCRAHATRLSRRLAWCGLVLRGRAQIRWFPSGLRSDPSRLVHDNSVQPRSERTPSPERRAVPDHPHPCFLHGIGCKLMPPVEQTAREPEHPRLVLIRKLTECLSAPLDEFCEEFLV